MAILFGLTTAFAYGTADFIARFSTRRVGVGGSLLGALAAGSLLLSLVLLLSGARFSALLASWEWLVLSGVLSYAMLGFLYAALERGPISIASPVVALHPALVVLLLFAGGMRPAAREWAGLALAVAGGFLLSTQIDPVGDAQGLARGHARKTALLAAFCAVTLSFQILCVQRAAAVAGPLAAAWGSRVFALLLALAALPLARGVRRGSAGGWALTLLQGSLDVTAVLALAAGSAGSQRAIVPVIGSGFSAVTVVLARVALREAMTRLQWLAIGVLLAGIIVLGWPR